MEIKKQSLFTGTIILLFSSIIVKGIGFFYRVFLVRVLGTEAMGLIEMISPVYSLFLVLAGWGISLGLSTKIAEKSNAGDLQSCRNYIKAAKKLLKLFGITATVISILSLPIIMFFIADKRSMLALITLLPAILFVTSASAYRGIFQGIRRVSELGNAQIIEQCTRVAVGVSLTFLLVAFTMEIRIIAVSLATLAGEIAGMLFIRHRYRKIYPLFFDNLPLNNDNEKKYCSELLKFGTPVTVNRLAASLIAMLQALLVPIALKQSGMSTQEATAAYGAFMSVAVSLLQMPGIFTSALSVSVIPAVAESINDKHIMQVRINKALGATVLFTLPGIICLYFFAEPLCSMLFHTTEGADALKILCAGGIFLYVQITLAGVLQGMGKVKELLKINVFTGIILIINIYLLTKIPRLGIAGTAWAFNIDLLLTVFLNYIAVKKHGGLKLDLKHIFIKPCLAAIIMITAIILNSDRYYLYFSNPFILLLSLLLSALIYFISFFAINGFKFNFKFR